MYTGPVFTPVEKKVWTGFCMENFHSPERSAYPEDRHLAGMIDCKRVHEVMICLYSTWCSNYIFINRTLASHSTGIVPFVIKISMQPTTISTLRSVSNASFWSARSRIRIQSIPTSNVTPLFLQGSNGVRESRNTQNCRFQIEDLGLGSICGKQHHCLFLSPFALNFPSLTCNTKISSKRHSNSFFPAAA